MRSTLFLFFMLFATLGHSQSNETEIVSVTLDSGYVSAGDTLIINLPATKDFITVQRNKKKIGLGKLTDIGNLGSTVGGAVASVGVLTKSTGAVSAGLDIMTSANVASSIGMTSDAIDRLDVSKSAKKLIGKKIVVDKIYRDELESEENPYATYAIGNLEGTKKEYKVMIYPATATKEVIVINQTK